MSEKTPAEYIAFLKRVNTNEKWVYSQSTWLTALSHLEAQQARIVELEGGRREITTNPGMPSRIYAELDESLKGESFGSWSDSQEGVYGQPSGTPYIREG